MIAVKPDDAVSPCDAAVDDAHDDDDADAVVSPPQRRKSQRLTVSDEEDDGLDGRNITTHPVKFFCEICFTNLAKMLFVFIGLMHESCTLTSSNNIIQNSLN